MDDEKIRQALAKRADSLSRGLDIPGPQVAYDELDDLQEFISQSGRRYLKSNDSKHTFPCLSCDDKRSNAYEIELELWCHICLHETVTPIYEHIETKDGIFRAETQPAVALLSEILARRARDEQADE